MGLARARLEHRRRRLVSVQHIAVKDLGLERIHERLQLHSTSAYPLGECGARDRQAGTFEDRFLAIERQVVGVLGGPGAQRLGCPCRSDALAQAPERCARTLSMPTFRGYGVPP